MALINLFSFLLLLISPAEQDVAEIEPVGIRVQVYPYGGYYSYPPHCPPGYSYGPYYGYYGRRYGCYPYGRRYYYPYYGRRYYYPYRYYGRRGYYYRHHKGYKKHHH